MPETYWTVRWPDGAEERLYSPSSVVTEIFQPGESYPLEDFLSRARLALERASDRVAAKYGFACSSAMDQLERIEARGANYQPKGGTVTCLAISQ